MTRANASLTRPALMGLGTFAWYAMPDAVRSRAARAALKTALGIGGTAALASTFPAASAPTGGPDRTDEVFHAVNQHPARYLLGGGALIAASTALSLWGEKAVFAFGERRRERGVPLAHTVPAVALAALGALAAADLPTR